MEENFQNHCVPLTPGSSLAQASTDFSLNPRDSESKNESRREKTEMRIMSEREQLSLKSLKAPWAELYPLGALEQRVLFLTTPQGWPVVTQKKKSKLAGDHCK